MYALEELSQMFRLMLEWDFVSCNIAISAPANSNPWENAARLLWEMLCILLEPESRIYGATMLACKGSS